MKVRQNDRFNILLGNNLRSKRLEKLPGKNMTFISEMLGVEKHCVGKWERGVSSINLENLVAYCAIIGVSPCDIIPNKNQYKPKLKFVNDDKVRKSKMEA